MLSENSVKAPKGPPPQKKKNVPLEMRSRYSEMIFLKTKRPMGLDPLPGHLPDWPNLKLDL